MTDSNKSDSPQSKWDDSEFHQQAQQPWWQTRRRELLLFGGLTAVLLIVIFWLPAVVDPVDTSKISSANESATTSTASETAVANSSSSQLESPWEEAQIAKARREAQEILAKLLDKQNTLEGMQVELWAKEAFEQAKDQASQGDELYRSREFPQAQLSYQSALQQFDELVEQANKTFEQSLQNGLKAIEAQQAQAAVDAYTLATAIRPHNQDAEDGLARAKLQDQVILLIEQAENFQHQYQFAQAKNAIEEALNIDPVSRQAKDKLREINSALSDANYASAMGQGYQNLEQGRFSKAIEQFQQALKIQPNDQSAKDAIVQAENQRTQQRIQNTLASAKNLEKQEQWQQALNKYQSAQSLDNSLVSARIGALRSKARADLDTQLQKLIDAPLRLADPAVYRSAQTLLSDARSVKPRGQRIDEQAKKLESAIEKALDPISVKFRSDNQTQVTVYKIGSLGLFTEQALELKPGLYTVVGSRSGYRDVREEITVHPGSGSQTVVIQCQEKISIGS
ncbi:MAG: hypothetical protein ACRBBW_00640 [Cellvibrionaceae bacterium]